MSNETILLVLAGIVLMVIIIGIVKRVLRCIAGLILAIVFVVIAAGIYYLVM